MKKLQNFFLFFFIFLLILTIGCKVKVQQTFDTPSVSDEQRTRAIVQEPTQTSNPLVGVWEITESWIPDSTGQLQKVTETGFYMEFTENSKCVAYTIFEGKFKCLAYIPYTVTENKLTYGNITGEWEIVDGKLELTGKNFEGKIAKSIYVKVPDPKSLKKKIN